MIRKNDFIKVIVTWVIMPCNLKDNYPEGGGACFLRNTDGVISPKEVILKATPQKPKIL
jgi:hypothetical protein